MGQWESDPTLISGWRHLRIAFTALALGQYNTLHYSKYRSQLHHPTGQWYLIVLVWPPLCSRHYKPRSVSSYFSFSGHQHFFLCSYFFVFIFFVLAMRITGSWLLFTSALEAIAIVLCLKHIRYYYLLLLPLNFIIIMGYSPSMNKQRYVAIQLETTLFSQVPNPFICVVLRFLIFYICAFSLPMALS